MIIRVMYTDFNYDYVDAATLDRLITHKRIRKFVRPSEDAWIDIAHGARYAVLGVLTTDPRGEVRICTQI